MKKLLLIALGIVLAIPLAFAGLSAQNLSTGEQYPVLAKGLSYNGTTLSATQIAAASTTAQPYFYAFVQSDLTKYLQWYQTALGAVIASNTGDMTISAPTGSNVQIPNLLYQTDVKDTNGTSPKLAWIYQLASDLTAFRASAFSMHNITINTNFTNWLTANGLFVDTNGAKSVPVHINHGATATKSANAHGIHADDNVGWMVALDSNSWYMRLYQYYTGSRTIVEMRVNETYPSTDPSGTGSVAGTTFTGKFFEFFGSQNSLGYLNYLGECAFNFIRPKIGTSTSYAKAGGKIFDITASVGNGTTVETDLATYTLPANGLANTGDMLRCVFTGQYAGHATADERLRVYFGGTAVTDTTALGITSASDWTITTDMMRVSSNTIRVRSTIAIGVIAFGTWTTYTTLGSLDFTTTKVVKITGQASDTGAASNQVVLTMGYYEFLPAA